MRTVWARKIRPSLGLRSPTNLESLLSRRTTSFPPRTRLQFTDAFLLLLAPVLTTAFFADFSWKERRRKEWDAKIAEAIAQVEQLRVSEQAAWTTLQHRSVRLGAAMQRRSYTTAAVAIAEAPEQIEDAFSPFWDQDQVSDQSVPGHSKDPDILVQNSTSHRPLQATAFSRQIAVKMALKLQLHVHLGKSKVYRDEYFHSADNFPDLNALARNLQQVERQLRLLTTTEMVEQDPKSAADIAEKSRQLDVCLDQLSTDYRLGTSSFPSFIDRVSDAILRSTAFPTVSGYTTLLQSICDAGFGVGTNSLAYHVLPSMDSRFNHLDRKAIFSIIRLFTQNRDTRHLDRFLRRLIRYSLHMPENERWEWSTLTDMRLPAPKKPDPRLVQILVTTALHCDQPHRAQAWKSLLSRHNGNDDGDKYFVKDFLRYYSQNQDWRGGREWLARACKYAPALAKQGLSNLQHVIFNMLEFCVACGRQGTYGKILQASVESGLGVYEHRSDRPPRYSPRSEEILSEWGQLHRGHPVNGTESPSRSIQRAQQFRQLLAEELESLDTLVESQSIVRQSEEPKVVRHLLRNVLSREPESTRCRWRLRHRKLVAEELESLYNSVKPKSTIGQSEKSNLIRHALSNHRKPRLIRLGKDQLLTSVRYDYL